MFGLFKTKKTTRKYRWCVKVKGTTISCHFTKKNAMKKAKSIMGAKIAPYMKKRKKATKTKRYMKRY